MVGKVYFSDPETGEFLEGICMCGDVTECAQVYEESFMHNKTANDVKEDVEDYLVWLRELDVGRLHMGRLRDHKSMVEVGYDSTAPTMEEVGQDLEAFIASWDSVLRCILEYPEARITVV